MLTSQNKSMVLLGVVGLRSEGLALGLSSVDLRESIDFVDTPLLLVSDLSVFLSWLLLSVTDGLVICGIQRPPLATPGLGFSIAESASSKVSVRVGLGLALDLGFCFFADPLPADLAAMACCSALNGSDDFAASFPVSAGDIPLAPVPITAAGSGRGRLQECVASHT